MPAKAPSQPARGRSAPIRVVFITLDNHLSGAVERAQVRLDARVAAAVAAGDGEGDGLGRHG